MNPAPRKPIDSDIDQGGSVGFEMAPTTELERAVNERLLDHELRYTTGRRALVEALRSAGGPVTLPELLDLAPNLAQSSAYRNLSLLEEAGVVRRLVHGGEHARFELAEALTEHHHHLVCDSCGLVRDVVLSERVEETLDASIADVARAAGFVPRNHALDVYGSCTICPQ